MRVIGVDYGLRRTGIAIGELGESGQSGGGGGMALPFEMFEGMADEALAAAIVELLKREGVGHVVVGLPVHGDGGVSAQSKMTERFILVLERLMPAGVKVERVTEYLSTHQAEGKLAGHYTRNQKRQRVDALAAAGILQDWLDRQRGQTA